MLLAVVPVAVAVVFALRRHKAAAWDRELHEAFGTRDAREIPERRSL